MEVVRAVLINLFVPALGFWFYWKLSRRMSHPLSLPLFLIFVSYGGWLMVVLTGLFGFMSGMATLGVAYLMFIAPIVMVVLAYRLWAHRNLSKLHFRLFWASAAYITFPLSLFLFWVIMSLKYGP